MSDNFNLLIAEDDHLLANSIKLMAPSAFKVFIATRLENIPDHIFFHAAIVDMHIQNTPAQGPDGVSVIKSLLKKNPHVEIVAMSGEISRGIMDASILAGAQRFLAKPLMAEELTFVLDKIAAYWQIRLLSFNHNPQRILIGTSPATEHLRKQIANMKNETAPILIEGETGSGKEVVAQILNHQEGKRPFVIINCAAISENLFESEIFGHTKGSFTGAETTKIGLAEAANGGDLFFDEIEALPLLQQAKLLRFIESGEIRRVGAKDSIYVRVRVIAASNRPLLNMVQEKMFREDLYFRLSSIKIELKPLRDRKADVAELSYFFIDKQRPYRNKTIEPEAIEVLKNYSWPGNVRELKRVCEQLVLTSPLPIITSENINSLLLAMNPSSIVDFPIERIKSLENYLNDQEKLIISSCLEKTKSIDKTCEVLKVSKSNLYKKIKDYGIEYE